MAGATATIFAQASGAGRSAVAMLRISGAESFGVIQKLAVRVPPARHLAVRALRNKAGEILDRAVVVWLPGPGSYTGEDSAEIHVHGGTAVLRAVSDALIVAGCRAAEPGEFTRRAFLNGRMDLLGAEGVADLVAAETEAQRSQALRQLAGEASQRLAGWAGRLRRTLAWQEALIDFPDEDLPTEIAGQLTSEVAALRAEIEMATEESRRGVRLRDGLVFAVTGAPNVGKSSLVNALSGRDMAIVAPSPGTTRDTLEVAVELGGIPVTLVDTAGLRDTSDPVEAEGVRRARARAAAADLVLEIVDAAAPSVGPTLAGAIRLANKVDLAQAPEGVLGVSALTGVGLDEVRAVLAAAAARLTAVAAGTPVMTRARHVGALAEAAEALRRCESVELPELRGEELRLAMGALGRITGTVDVEAILDTVFGAFCIGK
jgi:tRNA modification GTPase